MKRCVFIIAGTFILYTVSAQNELNQNSQIHGNFQIDAQTYKPDTLIDAPKVPEKMLLNSYANLTYIRGNFNAGIRFESYMNTLLGYDARYNGSGIPYKFITYNNEELEITAGNFYEQYGNGLILRAYEEKFIGYDNALEGVKVKYSPINGITFKGLTGRQRNFFDKGVGIVRGIDAEFALNDIFLCMQDATTITTIGGSFVSKFQPDKDPLYVLPENVAAWASRVNVVHGKWSVNTEYAYKMNDPSTDNYYIYKEGQALLMNLNYSTKGFGWILNAKRVDNMSFRSDRTATLLQLNINYIPVFTRTFTYTLLNKYPYATQAVGEMGLGTEILYQFKKETWLGGTYGTNISLNYNRIHAIDKSQPSDTNLIGIPGTYGYQSHFFKPGKELYYENITFEINKKFTSSFTSNFIYQYFSYNFDILRGMTGYGTVFGHVGIIDAIYRLNDRHAIHTDAEILLTKQDEGNWAALTIEYSIAPSWFFSLSDQMNFNNPKHSGERHFYFGSIARAHKGTRLQLGYGRQPQGVMCVGGVCRNVPASNGFMISISSTF